MPDRTARQRNAPDRTLRPRGIRDVLTESARQALKVSWTLIKVYVPLALATAFLRQIGVLDFIAPFFSPFMKHLGLPGEAALTLLAAFTNNIYAGIATMAAIPMTFRQVTILGIMIGLAHTLFIETAILVRLKMGTVRIAFFRIFLALGAGLLLNLLLPENIPGAVLNPYAAAVRFSWWNTLRSMAFTSGQIVVYMFVIMLAYELVLLLPFRHKMKKYFETVPRLIGFSGKAFVPWVVGLFIGITYGAGILFRFSEKNRLSHKDVCLTTVFLVLAHAIIEDTMVFVVVGGNFWIIILARVLTAFLVVRILSIGGLYRAFLWIGLPQPGREDKTSRRSRQVR